MRVASAMGAARGIEAFAVKLVAGLVIFISPVYLSAKAIFWLVLLDAIFGLIVAKKRGERIESRRFAHTPLKMFVYFGTLLATYHANQTFNFGIPADKIAAGIIGATELLSLLEKAEAITGAPLFQKLRDLLKPVKK